MPECLHVIALISGGKDSFFSLLHCIQNGHKVIALGNLYPAAEPPSHHGKDVARQDEDEHDLNSFMYQTVGHTVIPLYEKALGIPLYRQQITGSALQTGINYTHSDIDPIENGKPRDSRSPSRNLSHGDEDETEALVPLLRRIMSDHPSANAISTGAILSTYQRTRVESVALRLGLTPLSYLWQYPLLPPGIQTSLLQDMRDVGLDARIIKVASGGLDESFLWENVGSDSTVRRIERSMNRFGTDGDGAVLGEGGEFETLVVDGPGSLFKGRIVVTETDRKIVREGGGSAWLKILNATVVMQESPQMPVPKCRTPTLLDPRFCDALDQLEIELPTSDDSHITSTSRPLLRLISESGSSQSDTCYWTVSPRGLTSLYSVSEEAANLVEQICGLLSQHDLQPIDIISTIIVLRSMDDFLAVNKVYGSLFTLPNPPARVTIACGNALLGDSNLLIHLKVQNSPLQQPARRKGLHVQSRSYWAPANIGPYSQAISISQYSPDDQDALRTVVYVAGQIPLIPHTMTLATAQTERGLPVVDTSKTSSCFKLQAVLALQHLWRIGREMDVKWWTSVTAYLPHSPTLEISQQRAKIAGRVWARMHMRDAEDDDDDDDNNDSGTRDLWEERFYAGREIRGQGAGSQEERLLPGWDIVESDEVGEIQAPPFFAVEVEELPRGSQIEWHAHLGVTDGPVKLFARQFRGDEGWTIHQCQIGNRVQCVVMIDYMETAPAFKAKLEAAIDVLGDKSLRHYVAYIDISIQQDWCSGTDGAAVMIPSRSIYDAFGRRLAGVLLFDAFVWE